MDHFEATKIWNYKKYQYQMAIIERSFSRGCAHIIIHKWL